MRVKRPREVIPPTGYWLEAGDADEPNVPDAWDRLEPRSPEEEARVARIMEQVHDFRRKHPKVATEHLRNFLGKTSLGEHESDDAEK